MVQTPFGKQIDYAAARTSLGIGSTVDQPRDTRMDDRAGAHGAGFQRHVQRTAGQAVVAQMQSGSAERANFGMSGRIVAAYRRIRAAADDFTILYNYRTYRHFIVGPGLAPGLALRA